MKSQPTASVWFLFVGFLTVSLLWTCWPGMANAGCKINLGVKNAGGSILDVAGVNSKVKSKGGVWKRLSKGNWGGGVLKPGDTHYDLYEATFRCGAKRRYQMYYRCHTGPLKGKAFVDYYPAASGSWTTKQSLTISLRRCR